jgi:SAM-dependent methyltransferase
MEDPTIITLSDWFESPVGCYLLAWERAYLDLLTADIFGFNAVQIGLPQIQALAASRMPHIWQTDNAVSENNKISLTHDFAELPFATQSMDLVVLPHVLEFSAQPHQVLREVERVLIPEGRVIICGFNPASLWGLRHALGRLSGRPYLPAHGELISLLRLKDWLQLLNMEVDKSRFGCYAMPFSSYRWLNRCEFFERAGSRWWPYLGSVYVVQGIKRQKGMTLIGPVWRNSSRLVPKGVTATNKLK